VSKTEALEKVVKGLPESAIREILLSVPGTYLETGNHNHPAILVYDKNFKRRLGTVVCTWLPTKA